MFPADGTGSDRRQKRAARRAEPAGTRAAGVLAPARRLPPLNALRAFEAAGRHLSITRAAQELGVTQGAVSRQVLNLERHLGVALFHRGHREIVLTQEGSAYHAMLGDAFRRLHEEHARFLRRMDNEALRIKVPPTFAIRWLMARLACFHARHPKLTVQITTSHRRVDLAHDDVDVGIWSTFEPSADARTVRLFGEVLLPVCSPALIGRGPPLREPADLRHHILLHSFNRPEDWPLWLGAVGAVDVLSDRAMQFENSALAYQAAVESAGVAIAQSRLVEDDLSAGRLVAPFPVPVRSQRAYYLVMPHLSELPRRVRLFTEWLQGEVARAGAFSDGKGAAPPPAGSC